MLSAVKSNRAARRLAGLGTAAVLLAGCASTTAGTGQEAVPTERTSSTRDFPSSVTAPGDSASSPANVPSTTATETIYPAPPTPYRTVTVHAGDGTTYRVKIWFDIKNDSCYDHAHGQPIITFLTIHPCTSLERYLATTTVHGRPVAFAESATGFPGTAHNLYGEAGRFAELEQADGTGSINDLLMEGYRLPRGPTSIPPGEAFNVLGQDQGVTIWDAWYLDGPTPTNDPALMKMTQDLFLRF